jgi:GH43 family beta-xylosidase
MEILNHPVASRSTRQLQLALKTVPAFTNPLITSIPSSPDPWITCKDGYYYFCLSYRNALWVWKSTTLSGIDRGRKVKVWTPPRSGPNSKQLWAPELHFINGKWYIYYAADDGNNINHRMYVLESVGEDAQGEYIDRGKLTDPADKWAIDGTVLQKEDNSLYFIWSGWPGDRNGLQNLYIAPMSNPWTISGERVLLSTPEHSWESWINEGPQVLQRNGKIFVVYSANRSWTADYCLGLLTNCTGDVLNPAAWTKTAKPIFQAYEGPDSGVYCTGHCSFTQSPDGLEDWLLYHGKESMEKGWATRRTRAQKFGWNEDDSPNFSQPLPNEIPQILPSGEFAISYELSGPTLKNPVSGVWHIVVGAYANGFLPRRNWCYVLPLKLQRTRTGLLKVQKSGKAFKRYYANFRQMAA